MATFTNAELVAQLYIGFYDRAPDPVGLNYWIGRLDAGVSIQDVGDSFAASPEAADTYPYIKFPNLFTPDQFLEQVYLNVFGRAIDDDGLDYYKARIESGESLGSVVSSILGNATSNTTPGNTDAAFVANKVAVGLHWAELAATSGADIYQDNGRLTDAANASAHGVIDGVDATDASVEAALAEVDAYFGGGGSGGNFNLTSAIGEHVQGTSGADTFTGVVFANGTDGTFQIGDQVDGLGGRDTFNIFLGEAVTAAQLTPAGSSIANVEVINIHEETYTVSSDIDASAFGAAAQEIWQIAGAAGGFANVEGLAVGQVAGFSGGAAALTATVEAADGADSVSVALKGVLDGSAVTVLEATADDVTSVSISGSVAAAAGGGAGTLDIDTSGTGSVDTIHLALTSATIVDLNNAADVTTIDAAASTGALDIDVTMVTDLESLTSGSGNDTLTVDNSVFTAKVVEIDAGAGNDTINIDISYAAAAVATSLTGGAGGDMFMLDGGGNLFAAAKLADLTDSMLTITDFGNGLDTLNIYYLTSYVTQFAQNAVDTAIDGAADLFAAAKAVANLVDNGAGSDWAMFNFGDNAYIYVDNGGNGLTQGDALIQLTGVSVADLHLGTNLIADA